MADSVAISRIFLLLNNPRHEPVADEARAIEYLCEHEDVLPLARDIAKNGLSPLEVWALIPSKRRRGDNSPPTYFAAEGNRRLCAIKLLIDPDRAPTPLRAAFAKAAEQATIPRTIRAAIFDDIGDARIWLDRTHGGPQGGIGRRPWNSDQKARFDGRNKNRLAQAVLDYAEKQGMISPAERRGTLTTVQRFAPNPVFKEVLGLDTDQPGDLRRTRPKPEFDAILKRFMRDVVKKRATSRMNKGEIAEYARPLAALPGVTAARIPAEPLGAQDNSGARAARKKAPKKPVKAEAISWEQEIFDGLQQLANEKLHSLYHSICKIELAEHTPIIAVGIWAFFETLTSLAGRADLTSFKDFLSKNRLEQLGLTGKTIALRDALERIAEGGNTTKHHPIAVTFNGDQLNNDMTALKPVILKLIASAAPKRP